MSVDGRWLALGVAGVLALASAARRRQEEQVGSRVRVGPRLRVAKDQDQKSGGVLNLLLYVHGDFWPALLWRVTRDEFADLVQNGGRIPIRANDPGVGTLRMVMDTEISGAVQDHARSENGVVQIRHVDVRRTGGGPGSKLEASKGWHLVWDGPGLVWEGTGREGDRVWTSFVRLADLDHIRFLEWNDDKTEFRFVDGRTKEGSGSGSKSRKPGSAVRVGPRLRVMSKPERPSFHPTVWAIEPSSGRIVEVRAKNSWSGGWIDGPTEERWLRIAPTRGMIGSSKDTESRIAEAMAWSSSSTTKTGYEVYFPGEGEGDLVVSRFDLAIAVAAMAVRGMIGTPPANDYFVGGLLIDGRTRLVEQVVPLWYVKGREEVEGGPHLIAPVGTTVEVDLKGGRAATKITRGSRPFYGWNLHGIESLSHLKQFANDQEWGRIPF